VEVLQDVVLLELVMLEDFLFLKVIVEDLLEELY
jgi:hypothetical protein